MSLLLKTFRIIGQDRRAAFDAGDCIQKVLINVLSKICREARDHGSRVIVVFTNESTSGYR